MSVGGALEAAEHAVTVSVSDLSMLEQEGSSTALLWVDDAVIIHLPMPTTCLACTRCGLEVRALYRALLTPTPTAL
jgi:hypothetical protein